MPRPVARVLLTRRWFLRTALLLAVVAACAGLGQWQWQRGNVVVDEPAATRAVVPVQEVVDRGDALTVAEVGRRVRVRGEWDPAVQLHLPERPLDGAQGSWILGLVRTPDGTGVPVVRGWLPAGAAAPAPAAGPADVEGVVQPPEAEDQGPGTGPLPAGQVWVVSPARLVNVVDPPVVPAYVTATEAAARLRAVPPHDPGSATRRLDWRNLGYALQWVVFAGFAVVVWARTLREELAAGGAGPAAGEPPEDRPDPPGPPGGERPEQRTHPQADQHRPRHGSEQLLEERTR